MRTFLRIGTILLFATLLMAIQGPVQAQSGDPVVETMPSPPRTDQAVTIYFNADEGTGGLADHGGDVYAHTGISTDQNPEEAWKCVKNDWPTSESFSGNRDDTKLTRVQDNRYRLEIADIRAYYQDTSTSCSLGSDEEIQTMNLVFRSADGSKEGKAAGGDDIFVDVVDVSGQEPTVRASITDPTGNPPLYPFMVSKDTTVTVSASATVANVDSLREIRLFVDGSQVATTDTSNLSHPLTMDAPNQYDLRAEVAAASGDSTLVDTARTRLIRTPDVVDQSRPSGVQDGINYNSDGSVTLSLFAPNKDFVYAIGDFTDWDIDSQYFMKREQTSEGAHWWITLDNLNEGEQYDFQYFVDGEIRTSDPFAHKVRTPADAGISEQIYPGLEPYPGDKTEGFVSVIESRTGSDFQFSEFQPPKREDLVVYELLLRDFVQENSFSVLTDTLDYLDSLGVNAVELMPVANFGGNNSWGYNPNAHLALDKSYGTPRGFKQFVEEAHSRGIAVIMDVVYNHVTSQSPLAQLYGSNLENPFLEPQPGEDPSADRGFCDDFFQELNHGSPFIKRYIDRANAYWIEEYNVDGFRFDLAKCVADNGVTIGKPGYTDAVTKGWKKAADHVWDNVDEDTYMILEFFGETGVENELGGYRDDDGNTGSMMTWHNMNDPYSQADMGYEGESDLSGSYYGTRSGYDQASFIPYMESHDEQWLMRKKKAFGNSSDDYSTQDLETALQRQKLSAAFYFTLPGPRMTWQFSELGYGWGPDECLRPSEACPASAPGRTGPKPIRWAYRDADQHPERVKLYKAWSALLNLRDRAEVFSSTETNVSTKLSGDLGRRIVLEHDSMDAVVIGNFGLGSRTMSANFPAAGTWYDFYTGEAVQIEASEQDADIPLAPGEFHIYTSEPVPTPEEGLVPFESAAPPPGAPSSLEASTNFEAGSISLSWSASNAPDVVQYQVYRSRTADFDTTGTRIATVDGQTTTYTDTTVEASSAYFYRVAALDNDGILSPPTSALSAILQPETVPMNVSLSFGEGTQQENYRLVALPGQVSRDLGATFEGEAGAAWQAYWDNGTSSDFLVSFDGSSTFQFKPGRGFWAISESAWSIEESFSTVSLNQGTVGPVAVIDLHDGWNIISNPLGKAVSWARVAEANGEALQPLWRFNGTFSRTSTFASASSGEAFYFNNRSGLRRLQIPFVSSPTSSSSKATEAPDLLSLTAEGPDGATSTVRMGTRPSASDAVGADDVIAPPHRFEQLSLRVRAEETGESTSREQTLMQSVRRSGTEGQVWHLTLRSDERAPITLRADGSEEGEGQRIRLVNRETGESYDLRSDQSVRVVPSGASTRLVVITGKASFVEKEQSRYIPSKVMLRSNYPNPFRKQTTIEYTLPETGRVTVEVFDVLGRKVRVLANGRKKSGAHRVTWNGENRAGQGVASGVYLTRLTFKGETITQKMVLVK